MNIACAAWRKSEKRKWIATPLEWFPSFPHTSVPLCSGGILAAAPVLWSVLPPTEKIVTLRFRYYHKASQCSSLKELRNRTPKSV